MSQQAQRVAIMFLLAWSGCKSVAGDDPDQEASASAGGAGGSGGSSGASSGQPASDSGSHQPSSPSGTGGDDSGKMPASGGTNGGAGGDAGQRDAALPPDDQPAPSDRDAGAAMQEPVDAAVAGDAMVGMIGTESCCTQHASPGCSNADLQVCVCEKLSSCCTDAWSEACVLIVQERYCQPGVRDCVCGDGAGQWGQHVCCDSSWGSTCDTTAQSKCGAKRGCY